jgi:tetratricopeptide (TPR) repeat protein
MARFLRHGVVLTVLLVWACASAWAQATPSDSDFDNKADLLSAQARYPELVALCNAEIAARPEATDPYVTRGDAYWDQGYFREAIREAEKALTLRADEPSALLLRARAWESQGLRPELVQRDRWRAIQICTVTLRENPQDWDALATRAEAYDELRQPQESLKDYSAALALRPEKAVLYNQRALAYTHAGQYEGALHDYDETLRRQPLAAVAHSNRGRVYYRQGKMEAALGELMAALQINPDYVDALGARARLYMMQGKYSEALADAEHLLSMHLQDAQAYRLRGEARLGLATEDLKKAKSLDPQGGAGSDAERLLETHRLQYLEGLPPAPMPPPPPPPKPMANAMAPAAMRVAPAVPVASLARPPYPVPPTRLVVIRGRGETFTVQGFQRQGVTMAPVRTVERLGAGVTTTWGAGDVLVTYGEITLNLHAWWSRMWVRHGDDMTVRTLTPTPALTKSGVTYVPLRAVAEALGWTVQPDGTTIVITMSPLPPPSLMPAPAAPPAPPPYPPGP